MARIAGVKKIAIAKLTYDESGNPQFAAPVELPQFISFSGTKNFSEYSWYSNDMVEDTFKSVVDIDFEIVLGRLSNEIKADIMGSDFDTKGVMTERSDDAQNEFAVLVSLTQIASGNNGVLNIVYYRCKLNIDGTEAETQTDSTTDKPVTLSGKAIPLPDGTIARSIDSLDSKADASIVSGWFTKVYVPEA